MLLVVVVAIANSAVINGIQNDTVICTGESSDAFICNWYNKIFEMLCVSIFGREIREGIFTAIAVVGAEAMRKSMTIEFMIRLTKETFLQIVGDLLLFFSKEICAEGKTINFTII